MDFQDTPEALALREITALVLADHPPAAPTGSDPGDGIDWSAYRALADAGVVGIALPADCGGGGLGLLELHYVLEQIGAHVARVPVFESIVLGALTIARHGTPDQRGTWLPALSAGRVIITAALDEPGVGDPRAPQTRAIATGDGWRLSGQKSQVPLASAAGRVLTPAVTENGSTVMVLLDPNGPGVTLTAQHTAGAQPCFRLDLDDAPVAAADVVGGCGAEVLDDLVLRAQAALCSLQAGVCAAALRMAADYTGSRHQFGRPLSSFQAVGQRLADAFIDAEAVRLTALQAAWQLAEGRDARRAVAIAKWWAAEGGHRVLHAAVHVHGGIGIDLEYGLHRYFRLGKQIEFTLGSASTHLSALGRMLAADPADDAG